ncbi:MAG: polyphosphate:AMP phosphotransferase [Pseudomonadota bacterium]
MFESAQLEHALEKEKFDEIEPKLREDLLNAQFDLIESKARTILLLINGPDGSGKGEVTHRLYEWLDAHYLSTLTYAEPSEIQQQHPGMWKYWRDIPPRGRIGIVLGSWYHEALLARATKRFDEAEFSEALAIINRFESMLDAEQVTVVKLWLHIDRDESERRLKKLTKRGYYERPVVREWAAVETKGEFQRIVEAAAEMTRVTSTAYAPWTVVPAADARFRDVQVGTVLLEALRRATAKPAAVPTNGAGRSANSKAPETASDSILPHPSIVAKLDLSKTISKADYDEKLDVEQSRITRMTTSRAFEDRALVCVFEGNDAAGKGGAIGRVRQALDPRTFQVYPVAAPTDEERARPYLWRFWRHIPSRGRIAFFDRSWYGRVLVERVEHFCAESDVARAYGEINDFEYQLDLAGYIVVKFWLAISFEEQLRRFKLREATAFKRYKITAEDWRNREKWSLYQEAVSDMIDRTSTRYAPWTLVEAEDKRFARIKVLKTIADRIEDAL